MPGDALDPELSDAQLVLASAEGDRAAFSTLMVRHQARLWRCLQALTGSEQLAEEALQETFLAAWHGAPHFRGDARVSAWLLGMARRQAARTWRRRVGEPRDTCSLEDLGAGAGWGQETSPEHWASVLEDQARIHAALARLHPDDRELLVLRDLEQLRAAEAARILSIGVPALKSRLHRARLRLMAELGTEVTHG